MFKDTFERLIAEARNGSSSGCDRGHDEIFLLISCFYRDSSTKFFVPTLQSSPLV